MVFGFKFVYLCTMKQIIFITLSLLAFGCIKHIEPQPAKPKQSDGQYATLYGSYDEIYWFKIGTVPIKNNLHAPYKVVTTEDVLLAVNE